ncbi:ATP-dependent RNA helicase HrpA [Tsukamurella tyrosinosolvens]|uniref:ATP-dependent RNA helicase HrpA n=1 Tax=Tsukamurella tyrosinosolvens TaxID=57704 RepID=UPI000791F080|nr:ATP-dependent RNA helicase HrpA [Tsukamurella tyrosinosolvens]KXP05699.1 ATP-dependent RNA helicase HrpA [Tsukamurella tyrosinosolvens]KZL95517.1 ATP-dependent RNA helicase HrpA [Tsukamurella tyrosinosolvens]WEL94816.1 ATP-dependent RNA helicase HrpA [Tsukamurella tyrosinosolvens]
MTKQETRTARDDGDGGPSKRDLYAALGTDADPALTLRDEARLRGRLKRAKPSDLPKLAREIETARGRYAERKAAVPAIVYPENLPVSARREEIAKAIAENQVIILAGETGSGKTTQLPKICLELGRGVRGMIGHTQPRRLAARSVAERIAEETKSELGDAVGYAVRFTDRVSPKTSVKLMTDGILLRELTRDRLLRDYDTIIIDEAHERSLNIDFLLGYLRQILPRRPDLKVIVTSATIEPERFATHFARPDGAPAPVIEVSGRTYPVEIRYRPLDEMTDDSEPLDQVTGIVHAVDELSREAPGDVLVFLSGEREIRDAAEALQAHVRPGTEILPLYARLSSAEQHRVFAPHTGRRIVLSTNVAETSLTVPGIKYVVDTGTARISRYSVRTKVQRLPIEPVSQASAQQRSGRCGRTSDGIAIRLYSEEDFDARPVYTDPEILRTNLASVILSMTALELGEVSAFPFVQPPDERAVRDGTALLEELGALEDAHEGHKRLSAVGRQLADLPVDPRMARMLVAAREFGVLPEVLVIVAGLSIQDVRERPAEHRQAADAQHARFADPTSDFLSYLNLWRHLGDRRAELSSSAFRRECQREFLHYVRIREWQDLQGQLRQICRDLGWKLDSLGREPAPSPDLIHQAMLAGLLSQIGLREPDGREFLGARNTKFLVFPGSALSKKPPRFVMAGELVETSRLFARTVAKIEPEWAEKLAGPLAKHHYSEPHWSTKREAVLAKERVTLFGVPLVADRTVNFGRIDPVAARELFLRHALVQGEWRTRHPFFARNRALLDDAEYLEDKARRRDIVVDEDGLFDFYDRRVPEGIVSARHFDSWWKKASRTDPGRLDFTADDLLADGAADVTAEAYPTSWLQGRIEVPLKYRFEPGAADDGVTARIPVKDLATVRADGFEWLVPAMREDLAVALIKSLPKQLRREVVPAPDFAAAALARLTPRAEPLTEGLARELTQLSGTVIRAGDFSAGAIPDHLRVTFTVIGDDGRVLGSGKDLDALKRELGAAVQQDLSSRAGAYERAPAKQWTADTLGDVPRTIDTEVRGSRVVGFGTLYPVGDAAGVKVVAAEPEQAALMGAGLDVLLANALPAAHKSVLQSVGQRERLALSQSPYATPMDLVADCRRRAITDLRDRAGLAWTPDEFAALTATVRAGLGEAVQQNFADVAAAVATATEVRGAIASAPPALRDAAEDIAEQLDALLFPGFVAATPDTHLQHLPRYTTGAAARWAALPASIDRDDRGMATLDRVYGALTAKLDALPEHRRDAALDQVHWLIEELRVSLFAQSLGTAGSVSEKKVLAAIAALS